MSIRKSMIAGIGRNRELGKNNGLLWHIPEDLAYFKRITGGMPVIMGRATFLSLPETFRPLPGRTHVVLMREGEECEGSDHKDVHVVHSLESAFAKADDIARDECKDEIFVLGGGSIYAQTLETVDRLYLTEVNAAFPDADVFFPEYRHVFVREVSRKHYDNGEYTFDFVVLEKGV